MASKCTGRISKKYLLHALARLHVAAPEIKLVPIFTGNAGDLEYQFTEVSKMDVFLMIRRKKTTIFTDAKESTPVSDVKKIVEGILKIRPEDQKLFKDDQPLDDNKTLGDYGFTFATARAQAPATIGLACKQDDGEFEQLEITPLSSPPELPDVMKQQDSTSAHAQEQTAS